MGKWFKNKKRNSLRKVGYIGGEFENLTGIGLDQAIKENKRSFRMREKLDQGYFHHFVSFYALIENEKGRIETAHYSCIKFMD